MGSEHTAKAFDTDLQELTRLVAEMGGIAERMIVDSVDALIRRDVALGQRVVTTDVELDALQKRIEERAVLTIARRQPMAVDLREIVGAMRVATDLERIGDLAKNMGKRVAALETDFHPLKIVRHAQRADDLAQIDRHRLAPRDGEDGAFLDLALQRVDRRIEQDDALREPAVALGERIDRVGDLFFRETAHFGDHAGEVLQVDVEGLRGVMINHDRYLALLPQPKRPVM